MVVYQWTRWGGGEVVREAVGVRGKSNSKSAKGRGKQIIGAKSNVEKKGSRKKKAQMAEGMQDKKTWVFLLPRVPLLNAGSSKGRSDIWSVHVLFDFLFISTPEPALLLNEDREIWSKTSVVSKQSYELRLIMRKYLCSQYSVQFFLTLLVLKYFNGNLLLLSWVVIILQQCLYDLCFCCFCLRFTGRITLPRPICVDWYVLLRRFRLCNV